MPRRAERRAAQATAEWLVVLLSVSAALGAGVVWRHDAIASRVAAALARPMTSAALGDADIDAAIAGRPGALSVLGARAWLADDVGPAAAHDRIVRRVAAAMTGDHPAWGTPLTIHGAPLRGRRARTTITATGALEVRVVGFADERDAATPPTLEDRAGAAATSLGWAGAGALARRIARPLGLAVGAVQLAAGLIESDTALPAGTRAGDIVVCRPAVAVTREAVRPGHESRLGVWRVGVLRDGRLILDAVAPEDRCAPTGD
ncbi:MAG: hypothetical protein ACR2JV_08700 [Gaiellales bacterium]